MNSQAKIVATIGPATGDKNIIRKIINGGVDAVRLNSSWGTYEEHAGYIKNIKETSKEAGRHIPIILDLSGPRIQDINSHKFDIEAIEIITPKDLADLKFGVEQGVDYVAMSFVGSAGDIERLRAEMKKLGKVLPVIAKIERESAVRNIDEIIQVSEAIMIARGDLGSEVPLEQIPFIQEDVSQTSKRARNPNPPSRRTASPTVQNPVPTRAE